MSNVDDNGAPARALLAEDRAGAPAPEPWLAALIEREVRSEQRVRRLAVGAWIAVGGLVPLFAVSIFLVHAVADGATRDGVRAAVLVVGVFAILTLFVALASTLAWLFRPRRASLAALERRLAALEARLRR